jgi:hypothetical protein
MDTVGDMAKAGKVTDRFVSRTTRLAYLSPNALERVLLLRQPPTISCYDLGSLSSTPWIEQSAQMFS